MGLYIVQPPSGSLRSGGFAYNGEIGQRLAALGSGGLLEQPREALSLIEVPTGSAVLIDSLFLSQPLTPAEAARLRASAVSFYLLLHLLPFDDPTATEASQIAFRTAIERWLPLLTGVVVTGHGAAGEWCHHFPETFSPIVAPPAIRSLPCPRPSARRPHRLLSIGGLSPRKNPALILDVLSQLPSVDWSWDLVGAFDPDDAYTREFCVRLDTRGLRERVRMHGSISQDACDRLMQEADLLVSASRFESFGIATATALASGLPTLGFRVGDVVHWCSGEAGHWMLDPEDANQFKKTLTDFLLGNAVPRIPARVQMTCKSWEDTLRRLPGGTISGKGN